MEVSRHCPGQCELNGLYLLGELKRALRKERTTERAGGDGFVGIHKVKVGAGEEREQLEGAACAELRREGAKYKVKSVIPWVSGHRGWGWGSDFLIHSKCKIKSPSSYMKRN